MPIDNPFITYAAVVVGSYLTGSIPFGLLVGKLTRGVDLRQYGSGKTGAANALRVLGPRWSAVVLAGDLLKGFVPVLLAGQVGDGGLAHVLAGLSALTGHNWSVFIGFGGGRGISTGLGALLAMAPLAAAVTLVVGVVSVALSRYVSLGSLSGAVAGSVTLMLMVATGARPPAYLLYAIVGALIVILSHRDNIQRLWEGTERRLGERVEVPPAGAPGNG